LNSNPNNKLLNKSELFPQNYKAIYKSYKKMYDIGLLRHDLFGHAEEQIMKNCQERGLNVSIL
jgi:hypothetical protein